MDASTLIVMRLARDGYGSISELMAMPTDLVMDAMTHSAFYADYEAAYSHINQQDT